MKRPLCFLLSVFALALSSRPVFAQSIPAAFLTETKSWVMTSAASKRVYQVSVALPDGYSPGHAPYPVLYAADANSEFGLVVEAARLLAVENSVPNLVIVGIGYPNPGFVFKASGVDRALDLTPTPDPNWMKANVPGPDGKPNPSGGAPEFLDFIRAELVPAIEKDYNVIHDDRTWFGHSFGGLFGIYAMFHNEGLFKRFIIGSPSIWWSGKSVLKDEEAFAATHRPLPVRAFFSNGSLEPLGGDLRSFLATLQRRHYQGLEYEAHTFEGETHLSVIPASVSRGLRYIFGSQKH